mmetsp:Transcript_28974/g.96484  ORF Transcript_28974/g.96484 Transcript_28974/m.96484 type:complete len:365 (+) Transcript_28974:1088-2182(+)
MHPVLHIEQHRRHRQRGEALEERGAEAFNVSLQASNSGRQLPVVPHEHNRAIRLQVHHGHQRAELCRLTGLVHEHVFELEVLHGGVLGAAAGAADHVGLSQDLLFTFPAVSGTRLQSRGAGFLKEVVVLQLRPGGLLAAHADDLHARSRTACHQVVCSNVAVSSREHRFPAACNPESHQQDSSRRLPRSRRPLDKRHSAARRRLQCLVLRLVDVPQNRRTGRKAASRWKVAAESCNSFMAAILLGGQECQAEPVQLAGSRAEHQKSIHQSNSSGAMPSTNRACTWRQKVTWLAARSILHVFPTSSFTAAPVAPITGRCSLDDDADLWLWQKGHELGLEARRLAALVVQADAGHVRGGHEDPVSR